MLCSNSAQSFAKSAFSTLALAKMNGADFTVVEVWPREDREVRISLIEQQQSIDIILMCFLS